MKKIILTLFLLVTCTSFSQVISSVDFHVINSGMEEDYFKLEEIWKEFHKKNMEDGKMIRWTMLKVNKVNGGPDDSANFVTVNTFRSLEDYNSIWENVTPQSFNKLVKKRLRGKMSSKNINKILSSNIKKGHRSYMIKPLSGTSPAPKLQKGDIILLDAMTQKSDDYENYEISFAKEIMQSNVDEGKLKLWGFTKIFDRNESAAEGPTHFTWRVPESGKNFEWGNEKLYKKFGNKFVYDKMFEMAIGSRTSPASAELEIIEIMQ